MQAMISDLVRWLVGQIEQAGRRGTVVGVSGGVDSAVVAGLCRRATDVGRYLYLDCESDPTDRAAAEQVAAALSVDLESLDLTPTFHSLLSALGPTVDWLSPANLKPRLRMTALYYIANREQLLVVGTSNLPERMVGYFTKWGDGAADVLPLGNLVKREVYAVGRELGLPAIVLDRPPSAGLYPGQTDEGDMGVTYRDLDAFFRSEQLSAEVRDKIERMVSCSAHKRAAPPMYPGFGKE